jgi:hypothetical protein
MDQVPQILESFDIAVDSSWKENHLKERHARIYYSLEPGSGLVLDEGGRVKLEITILYL